MRTKETTQDAARPEDQVQKKKPGRKPMTAEERAAAAKARAEEKQKADSMKPELFLQYQGGEVDMSALIEAAKADFRNTKKRTLVTSMKMYIKPEEHAVYYVINERYEGKISTDNL